MLAIAQLQYHLCRDVPLYQDSLHIGMSNACDCPAAVSAVPRRTSVSRLLVHRHVELGIAQLQYRLCTFQIWNDLTEHNVREVSI